MSDVSHSHAVRSEPLEPQASHSRRADTRVVVSLVLLVSGMTGLSFAAVPLYSLFCAATGYGGTTKRAAAAPQASTDRPVTVHFDANISSALKWDFQPEQREVTLKIGENRLAFYRATNTSTEPLTGTATFNVTPEIAGSYFNKIDCFCFTEQTLQPGQSADFPVSFFVDPEILNDPDAKHIEEITLSYTFFRANKEASAASRASEVVSPGGAAAGGATSGGAATRSFEKAGSSG
jgi:cytochrome c oxidase assembly protein subunit 11